MTRTSPARPIAPIAASGSIPVFVVGRDVDVVEVGEWWKRSSGAVFSGIFRSCGGRCENIGLCCAEGWYDLDYVDRNCLGFGHT